MSGLVRPVANERDALLAVLGHQREVLRITAYGLDDAQALSAPSASPLTVAGLINHAAHVERFWINDISSRGTASISTSTSSSARTSPWRRCSTCTAASRRTQNVSSPASTISARRCRLRPAGVPWFPDDVEAWSVRWVLLHLIQETARHAGHADIVRESVDGATAFPLMAAVEGWPATEWIQPWRKTA